MAAMQKNTCCRSPEAGRRIERVAREVSWLLAERAKLSRHNKAINYMFEKEDRWQAFTGFPIIFILHQHCPQPACHAVCKCNDQNHAGFLVTS